MGEDHETTDSFYGHFTYCTVRLWGGSVGGVGAVNPSDQISEEEQLLRLFAAGNGDLEDLLTAGSTVHAREVGEASILLDETAGTTALTDASISLRDDGERLILNVNGTDYEFDPLENESVEPSQYRRTSGHLEPLVLL